MNQTKLIINNNKKFTKRIKTTKNRKFFKRKK